MHRGYTVRWRKRWDKGYHRDHLLWVMMDWFIDHANYEDNEKYFQNYGKIQIKRGQHIFSIRGLAEILGCKSKRVRNRLLALEKSGFLALQRTHRFTIATILNYDTYQDIKNKKAHKGAHRGHSKGTPGATHNTLEYIKYIIKHINNISGRNFTVQGNADYIHPRLKEGYTKEQCIQVINKKWDDPDFNRKYFRPSTLFRKSKFEGYLNEDIGKKPEERSYDPKWRDKISTTE